MERGHLEKGGARARPRVALRNSRAARDWREFRRARFFAAFISRRERGAGGAAGALLALRHANYYGRDAADTVIII